MLTSDAMFKTNVDTITDAKSIIRKIKPRSFYYDTTNVYGMNFSNKKQLGIIAQDALAVPELAFLVGTATKPAVKDSAGNIVNPAVTYKTFNYNGLFALYAKGYQELSNTVDSMRTILASCCTNTTAARNINNGNSTGSSRPLIQTSIELSDKTIFLGNPIPNPWSDYTTINYTIQTNFSSAQITFSTIEGRLIKTVELKEKGEGQLNIYSKELNNGIYVYTLTVDNKIIDSKKMVKQN